MKKIHFIFWKYEPHTASFQRKWGFAKGLAEAGVLVDVIFLMPNNNLKSNSNIPNLRCHYYGDTYIFNFSKVLCLIHSILKVFKTLHKRDVLFLLEYNTVLVFNLLFLLKKINLYIEYTEYPPYLFSKKIFSRIEFFSLKILLRKCKGIFVISKNIKDYMLELQIPSSKVHIVNMIVDSTRFLNLTKTSKEKYICYCGTVSNFKDGVDILLQSFASILPKFPDLKLYILGPTPYAKDNAINNAIIEKYSIQNSVYMPGKVSAQDMPKYLVNATVLALPRPSNIQSLYGFPTKLGEYLMSGNVSVITRVGELDRFLQNGVNCLFATPNDVNDFSKQLSTALTYTEKSIQIGRLGREVALANFNYFTESQKIFNVIFQQ